MADAERYPNGVKKLSVLHRDSQWVDAAGAVWRWDDWYGWCRKVGTGWEGSFQTVEGAPPYTAVTVKPADV